MEYFPDATSATKSYFCSGAKNKSGVPNTTASSGAHAHRDTHSYYGTSPKRGSQQIPLCKQVFDQHHGQQPISFKFITAHVAIQFNLIQLKTVSYVQRGWRYVGYCQP